MSELNNRPCKIKEIFGFDVWIAVQEIFKFSAFKFILDYPLKRRISCRPPLIAPVSPMPIEHSGKVMVPW